MVKDTTVVYNSFVFLSEGFPVLPIIFMHCPHPKDGDEYQKEPHDAEAPWGLHYMSNEQLYVGHL